MGAWGLMLTEGLVPDWYLPVVVHVVSHVINAFSQQHILFFCNLQVCVHVLQLGVLLLQKTARHFQSIFLFFHLPQCALQLHLYHLQDTVNPLKPFKSSRCIVASFCISEQFPTPRGCKMKIGIVLIMTTSFFICYPLEVILFHYKSMIATGIRGL